MNGIAGLSRRNVGQEFLAGVTLLAFSWVRSGALPRLGRFEVVREGDPIHPTNRASVAELATAPTDATAT